MSLLLQSPLIDGIRINPNCCRGFPGQGLYAATEHWDTVTFTLHPLPTAGCMLSHLPEVPVSNTLPFWQYTYKHAVIF